MTLVIVAVASFLLGVVVGYFVCIYRIGKFWSGEGW